MPQTAIQPFVGEIPNDTRQITLTKDPSEGLLFEGGEYQPHFKRKNSDGSFSIIQADWYQPSSLSIPGGTAAADYVRNFTGKIFYVTDLHIQHTTIADAPDDITWTQGASSVVNNRFVYFIVPNVSTPCVQLKFNPALKFVDLMQIEVDVDTAVGERIYSNVRGYLVDKPQ